MVDFNYTFRFFDEIISFIKIQMLDPKVGFSPNFPLVKYPNMGYLEFSFLGSLFWAHFYDQ